jgi:hypothetical protein
MWPVGNGNRRLTHVDVPDAFSVIMAVSITQGVRLIFFLSLSGRRCEANNTFGSIFFNEEKDKKIKENHFRSAAKFQGPRELQGGARDE